jgi:DNA-directed RNA polymerase subunit E'/Rpb7
MQDLDKNRSVGSLVDFVNVPYDFGENTIMAHLNTSYYHVHGKSFVYPDRANEIILTSVSGAWNEGAKIQVIPANVLTVSAFDLHWLNISDISANAEIQVNIYAGLAGSEVKIGGARAVRTSNFTTEGSLRVQVPQQPKGTRITCTLSDSIAGTTTCKVSFSGHYYAN